MQVRQITCTFRCIRECLLKCWLPSEFQFMKGRLVLWPDILNRVRTLTTVVFPAWHTQVVVRLLLFCSSMNEVVHTSPTIGSNVEELVVNNTRFLMWDIGGQESLRSSWNTYYTNTEVKVYTLLKESFLFSYCRPGMSNIWPSGQI